MSEAGDTQLTTEVDKQPILQEVYREFNDHFIPNARLKYSLENAGKQPVNEQEFKGKSNGVSYGVKEEFANGERKQIVTFTRGKAREVYELISGPMSPYEPSTLTYTSYPDSSRRSLSPIKIPSDSVDLSHRQIVDQLVRTAKATFAIPRNA